MVSIGDASVKTMEKIGNNWSSTINIWKLKLFNHQNTRYLTWWFPRSPKLQVEMFTMLRWYRVLTYVVAIIQVTIPSHLFWIMLDLIKQNMGCDGNSWDIWNEKHKNSWFLCFFNGMHPPFFGHHRDNCDKPLLVGGFNQPLWKIWKSVGMMKFRMILQPCSKPPTRH